MEAVAQLARVNAISETVYLSEKLCIVGQANSREPEVARRPRVFHQGVRLLPHPGRTSAIPSATFATIAWPSRERARSPMRLGECARREIFGCRFPGEFVRAISPADFVILIFPLFTVSPSRIYPRCERRDDCGSIIL